MDKTCKSSADHRVAIFCGWSGARVRNTWVICREVWDNLLKGELIPNATPGRHLLVFKVGDRKGLTLHDKPAAYQLVGEVMAHQG